MQRTLERLGEQITGQRWKHLTALVKRAFAIWHAEGSAGLLRKVRRLTLTWHLERKEIKVIDGDSEFDREFFLGLNASTTSRREAIRVFAGGWRGQNAMRRPSPAFQPEIYAVERKLNRDSARPNPLTHYILQGKPQGPWNTRLIRPDPSRVPSGKQKSALHVHAYYPDMLGEILRRVALNSIHCDLFITTPSHDSKNAIEGTLGAYDRRDAEVHVIPNRGRNLGAFVYMLNRLKDYDVVGHVHTKKSDHTDSRIIDAWRHFLLANVLGDPVPMMDRVLGEFAADPKLGIVFPDDPHLTGWTKNRQPATLLLQRLKLDMPLPDYFDFPNGAMFWVRPAALVPLSRAKLSWEEFPREPVPYDGTLLHALERLIPLIVVHEGFKTAETVIPGVIR